MRSLDKKIEKAFHPYAFNILRYDLSLRPRLEEVNDLHIAHCFTNFRFFMPVTGAMTINRENLWEAWTRQLALYRIDNGKPFDFIIPIIEALPVRFAGDEEPFRACKDLLDCVFVKIVCQYEPISRMQMQAFHDDLPALPVEECLCRKLKYSAILNINFVATERMVFMGTNGLFIDNWSLKPSQTPSPSAYRRRSLFALQIPSPIEKLSGLIEKQQ